MNSTCFSVSLFISLSFLIFIILTTLLHSTSLYFTSLHFISIRFSFFFHLLSTVCLPLSIEFYIYTLAFCLSFYNYLLFNIQSNILTLPSSSFNFKCKSDDSATFSLFSILLLNSKYFPYSCRLFTTTLFLLCQLTNNWHRDSVN